MILNNLYFNNNDQAYMVTNYFQKRRGFMLGLSSMTIATTIVTFVNKCSPSSGEVHHSNGINLQF